MCEGRGNAVEAYLRGVFGCQTPGECFQCAFGHGYRRMKWHARLYCYTAKENHRCLRTLLQIAQIGLDTGRSAQGVDVDVGLKLCRRKPVKGLEVDGTREIHQSVDSAFDGRKRTKAIGLYLMKGG